LGKIVTVQNNRPHDVTAGLAGSGSQGQELARAIGITVVAWPGRGEADHGVTPGRGDRPRMRPIGIAQHIRPCSVFGAKPLEVGVRK
jgi:hypothetical protein